MYVLDRAPYIGANRHRRSGRSPTTLGRRGAGNEAPFLDDIFSCLGARMSEDREEGTEHTARERDEQMASHSASA